MSFWTSLQRLFSNFASGWPGRGLLLLRIAASNFLVHDAYLRVTTTHHPTHSLISLIAAGGGVLLLVGLWTPVTAAIVSLAEIIDAFARPADCSMLVLMSAGAAALAMLGPGAWSLDARLFGRKRIDIGS